MTFAAILELVFKHEALGEAREWIAREAPVTRSFAGSLAVEVFVDDLDPNRFVLVERWESRSADDSYRRFRGGEGKMLALPKLLSQPAVLSRFDMTDI